MGERNAAKTQLGTKMSDLGVPWLCMAVRCPPPCPPPLLSGVYQEGGLFCCSYSVAPTV